MMEVTSREKLARQVPSTMALAKRTNFIVQMDGALLRLGFVMEKTIVETTRTSNKIVHPALRTNLLSNVPSRLFHAEMPLINAFHSISYAMENSIVWTDRTREDDALETCALLNVLDVNTNVTIHQTDQFAVAHSVNS